MKDKLPRGIRNNNPGNIRHGKSIWQGTEDQQTDKDFVQFVSPVMGLRALMRLLLSYHSRGYDTVPRIIGRYAPTSENNTSAYVKAVCAETGFKPSERLMIAREDTLVSLAKAIVLHENGQPPADRPAYWYPASAYVAAAMLALGVHGNEQMALRAAQQRLST